MLDYAVDHMSASVSKKITLLITAMAGFAATFMLTAVNVALPTIGNEFGTEAVMLGWVANAGILVSAIVLLPTGRLADIYGRKKVFLYGVLLSTVSSFLCAIANSSISLIAFRALQGISSGMAGGTAIAILTSVFPIEERGKALGINIASVYLGLSLAPFLGGVLTQHLGWRSIFFFGALLGLVTTTLAFWNLKGEWAEAKGERFDIVGSIIFGISLLAMIYGFTILPTVPGIVLVLVGSSGMAAFTWWEAKVESPILNVALFRKNTAFIFSNMATLVNYSATYAVAFLLSLYLQYTKGFSPQTAGLILITQPAVMAIIAPIAGRLSDRIEPQKVAAIGMAFGCLALLLFVFLNEATATWYITGSLVIFGLGAGLFSSPNTNAVMSSVEKKFFGVASGTQATMRSCGMTLSIGIVLILFSIYIGNAQITPEYYPAFLTTVKLGFTIFGALCFGGIFAQLAGRQIAGPAENNPG
ncbi:MAG TPA: MFS transporter [Dehalococcoidia bacterium]|nr:MFS transporter [Dehalococcoidia bacterium]